MFPGEIDVQPSTYLGRLGDIFARFGDGTQDSGNVSYGVRTANARYFVKTAGDRGNTEAYLGFDDRVGLLRNAAELAQSVSHPTLPALHAAGWVPGDFYDSSMLYDFGSRSLTVFDLDSYHRGAYRNTMGRMFGSSQFMAPEEQVLGAPIDTRTTAYVMARTARVLLPEPPPALDAVLVEATTARFPDYRAFYDAWLTASSTIEESRTSRST